MLNASVDVDTSPATLPPAIARVSQLVVVSERARLPAVVHAFVAVLLVMATHGFAAMQPPDPPEDLVEFLRVIKLIHLGHSASILGVTTARLLIAAIRTAP